MGKINENKNKLRWLYLAGFFIILALPVFIIPPYFFPADWGKSIIFRSILSILFFLFLWQILYRKNEISLPTIKNNKIIWALAALLIIYLLASIFSVDPFFSFWGNPYRSGGFATFAFYFVFVIMAFVLFKKEDPSTDSGQVWEKAWIFSIFIGVLVSLIGIIQYYELFNNIFVGTGDRPPSTMGNTDILGLYLLLLLFITLSYAIKEPFDSTQGKAKKIFYFCSLALFFYVILITGARAAYFGLLIGIIYFALFYPKKIRAVKIATVSLLILAAGIVFYANTVNQYPKFLQQNRLFNSIVSRLSIADVIKDPRFATWQIETKAFIAKPILGYGPENFAVGFDKYYDPSIPYLNSDIGWWDRAHNIIIQTVSDAGIFAVLIYLALFIVLFWQLNKIKHTDSHRLETKTADSYGLKTDLYGYAIVAHGIQATLIGYLVVIFFSFDTFSTYLIFFLLVAYTLHLTSSGAAEKTLISTQKNAENISENQLLSAKISEKTPLKQIIKYKTPIIIVLFILLVIFLWQYNILPSQINAEINIASSLASQKKCDQAFSLMDKILPEHSFLDSYEIMEYVTFEKNCSGFYPENILVYTKRGLELMQEAVKIQPLYTRYWIYMGNLTTTLAGQETDPATENNLIEQAINYFNKALQLAPKHQEILIGLAKIEIDASDYKDAEAYSEKCIAINPNLGDCYWYLGLAEIYTKDSDDAKKNIQLASDKSYDINSEASLIDLANAYGSFPDYQNLAIIFEKLIAINPNEAPYYSSLASFYAKLGEYDKARQEELKFLQLSPESKQDVDDFLKTLP